MADRSPKVCVITNMCPHYRYKLFAHLKKEHGFSFYFFDDQERTKEDVKHLKIFAGGDGLYSLPPVKILKELLQKRFDVIIKCTNNKWLFFATFALTKLLGARFVVWHSLWYYPDTLQYRLFGHNFVVFLKRYAHGIVVYGEHGERFLIDKGIRAEKIFTAFQAVDNDFFGRKVFESEIAHIRDTYGLGRQRKIVLFVGRFVEEKGIRYLLQALNQLKKKDFTFLAVGEGELRGEIEEFCRKNGIDFRLAGFLTFEDLPPFYKMATVLVLPSITTRTMREPWGLVVNEAFNQGCPAVVTDAVGAGAGGLVIDEFTGLVVPEKNPEELAGALGRMITDDALRQTMSQNASSRIKSWTYERQADGFVDAVKFVTGRDTHESSPEVL